ncbi:phosphatidate cytidylyltransferase [Entomospira entomophila]|uniref:Phosphatidate cytidylyltransferase n=1 Tax=Entomospira entomophila TaxID=2719988 RepID=A0A968KRY1_9SPIO|nr:phosphatidate cytidylyltransferase [Entomospira entomophilus]NIZ41233.1 phosphatidate cytidylyltransferase [Entomospira entomophilus]WDI35438.1 phosphatidate cytidylyltransferase [Entomospira entomophilus]
MQNHQRKEFWETAKQELMRKVIHMGSILSIFVAKYSLPLLISILVIVTLIYIFAESLRLIRGGTSLITQIVSLTKRGNEDERPALGPITLSIGVMCAFIFFPPVAARIAVAALAFGDGLASLVGRLFGRLRPAFLRGKSIEGSLSCLIAVFATTWFFSKGHLLLSVIVAVVVTIVEALPLKSFDNIAIPIVVGLISYRFGF